MKLNTQVTSKEKDEKNLAGKFGTPTFAARLKRVSSEGKGEEKKKKKRGEKNLADKLQTPTFAPRLKDKSGLVL